MSDTGKAIIMPKRHPLGGLTAEEFEERLRAVIAGRASRAYVFGSLARREMTPHSDVDLMVVVPSSDKSFVRRAEDFFDLLDLHPEMDLLVYTEAEFTHLVNEPTTGFWKSVIAEMRRIL